MGDNMKTNITFNEMKAFFAYLSGGAQVVQFHLKVKTTGLMVYTMAVGTRILEETKQILKSHLDYNQITSNISDGD